MFGFGTSWDPVKDVGDLTGKVALVTGGNAGIGSATVEQLAAHGAKVYLGARSEERAKAAIKKIEDAHPAVKEKGLLVWLPVDLTEPVGVVKAAKEFMAKEEKLDILINNAARLVSDYELSPHGLDLSVQINHIGHFVLVNTLLPVLKSTAALPNSDVRIVIMSSDAQQFCPKVKGLKTVEELNKPWSGFESGNSFWASFKRYSFSKLLNELFKVGLLSRLEGSNIIVVSTNPGMVNTKTSYDALPFWLKWLALLFGKSVPAGAVSVLFAATSPKVRDEKKYHGAYVTEDTSIAKEAAQAKDKKLADELWNVSEQVAEKIEKGEM